jgi:hypothetical protein
LAERGPQAEAAELTVVVVARVVDVELLDVELLELLEVLEVGMLHSLASRNGSRVCRAEGLAR